MPQFIRCGAKQAGQLDEIRNISKLVLPIKYAKQTKRSYDQYRGGALPLEGSAFFERRRGESLGRLEELLRLRLSSQHAMTRWPFQAKQGIAVLRGLVGDHRAALRDLERLMPLAHTIGKHGHSVYFAFLNSCALELSESGQGEEAEQVANVVAASPFINSIKNGEKQGQKLG